MKSAKSQAIILCAGESGQAVVYGYVDQLPEDSRPVTVYNARMVIYWAAECGGIFGLAANGPQGKTKITAVVEATQTTVWKQFIVVSKKAEKLLNEWPEM